MVRRASIVVGPMPVSYTHLDVYKRQALSSRLVTADGKPVKDAVYNFAWMSNPGTLLIISGLVVAVVYFFFNEKGRYAFKFPAIFTEFGSVVYRMRWSILTIASRCV